MPHLIQEGQTQDPSGGMQTLPTGCPHYIVDSATKRRTIYRLLFVSSHFNYEAERALYRRISVRDRKAQEMLFQRLSGCPRVAKLVFDLDIVVSETIAMDDNSFWSQLSLALRALVDLKALAILCPRAYSRKAYLLDGCLFQLERFSWPFVVPEEGLLHFLENQPRIRTLSLQWRSSIRISSKALPRLSILDGTSFVINSLLPERRVTHLFWKPYLSRHKLDLGHTGPPLNNIRVLKYRGLIALPLLKLTFNYLEKVEVLERDMLNPHDITELAPLFPNLQKLILPHVRVSNPQIFIESLFASVPTLRVVDSGLGGGASFRWSRDSSIKQPIIMHYDDWMAC